MRPRMQGTKIKLREGFPMLCPAFWVSQTKLPKSVYEVSHTSHDHNCENHNCVGLLYLYKIAQFKESVTRIPRLNGSDADEINL